MRLFLAVLFAMAISTVGCKKTTNNSYYSINPLCDDLEVFNDHYWPYPEGNQPDDDSEPENHKHEKHKKKDKK